MSYRARQRSENKRAGGLKGRDRGWLPGSSQSNSIGIPHNLVNKTRERTNTLVTREAAANIAGGQLTEPLPDDYGKGDILIDTRSLVVNTNQLGGIGRFRSQFNVDADGIIHARYYLPIYPKNYFRESIGDCNTICEKARPNSVIQIGPYSPYIFRWNWTVVTPTGILSSNWSSVASSSDGTMIVAAESGDPLGSGGFMWLSTNSGQNWNPLAPQNFWTSVAMSSNGQNIAAVADVGNIWVSNNSGQSWSEKVIGSFEQWASITMSSNGQIMAAVAAFGDIWISTDSGQNWTPKTAGSGSQQWTSITMSSNGQIMAAVEAVASPAPPVIGGIWISTDSGQNWTQKTAGSGNQQWYSITSSLNGAKLAVCANDGYIWRSSDQGDTWLQDTSVGSVKTWVSIASSSNGSRLAAAVSLYGIPEATGEIWISSDSGETWKITGPSANWSSIASSANGTQLVAAVYNGEIYRGVYA